MGSVSSEEESDQRCGSYSLSADVSESESCSSFSCRRFDGEGASSSMASSPLPVAGNFCFSSQIMLPVIGGKDVVVWEGKSQKTEAALSEVEMMKERFAKLLLGEDMSGGGKGVCTALAISNAITNLSATVFGELWRLEPLATQKKAMWRREMEWLLFVSDSIVELVPSIQQFPGGGTYEVMEARPRSDLHINLPALKKLDAMLIGILDEFKETEFWYIDHKMVLGNDGERDAYTFSMSRRRPSVRQQEKWWLPCPKVPCSGLSEDARKKLQQCKDCTNQILKAAMAINSNVLAEMEIPNAFLDNLPKSGKACLGNDIYRHLTADQFASESLLDHLDLSSEHRALELANRVEAALHVWNQRDQKKHINVTKSRHSSWGGKVRSLVIDAERNHSLIQRAETLLLCLKLRFPGLPQTALDMNKIQYNKDVGQAILESYSRVMESLAFNVMARIDDVLYADDSTRQSAAEKSKSLISRGGFSGRPIQKQMSSRPFSIQHSPYASPLASPRFSSSTATNESPERAAAFQRNEKEAPDVNLANSIPADLDKIRSYADNVTARRVIEDAPERD